MPTPGPVRDLAGLTLEVNHLPRAERFYNAVLGLTTRRLDEENGVLDLEVNAHQTLSCWKPITRRANEPRLARLGARGGTHVHYAWQIPMGSRETAKAVLDAHGIGWQEINLGTPEEPDLGVYFFDPFGHGLELREVVVGPDPRRPLVPPEPATRPPHALPVVGLREVALAYADYAGMLERLPAAYGLPLLREMEERAFAQFTLGPEAEADGHHTPRRWLYAWDPQVGLADMLGGEHATLRLYADVDEVAGRVRAANLEHFRDSTGLAVRDPEGHVLEFVPGP